METYPSLSPRPLVAVKGAGDLASGVIHRLCRAGFPVVASELACPTVLRRPVAFAEAVPLGEITVEGVTARRVSTLREVDALLARGEVPVLVDPSGAGLLAVRPWALVEATLAKRNSGIGLQDAQLVIALGPGYIAGQDVHAVVETQRGHHLGRVYWQGMAEADTGVPGIIGGYGRERVLRAPCAGICVGTRQIGDLVEVGEQVAFVEAAGVHTPVCAQIRGMLRGLLRSGLPVGAGMKVGDIDPRAVREHCFAISDKSRAVAGGVLEALLTPILPAGVGRD